MVWVQIRQCNVERRGGVLSRPAGRCYRAFRVTVQDDYGLCILWAHGVSVCGCIASVPARNDRLRRASSPHLPPTSGQALCSTAGVYKFTMPSLGIQNRARVRRFFHECVRLRDFENRNNTTENAILWGYRRVRVIWVCRYVRKNAV